MWTQFTSSDEALALSTGKGLRSLGDVRFKVTFQNGATAFFWTYNIFDAQGVASALSEDVGSAWLIITRARFALEPGDWYRQ